MERVQLNPEGNSLMARPKSMEKMSLAELSKMQADIERMKAEKQNSERAAVREKIMSVAKEHGVRHSRAVRAQSHR
jgi:hypothetical protein